ncbi:MAG: hypothetical protein WBM90_00990 [Acidimicrobiia bacterium]
MLEFVIGYSAGQRTASRAASLARSAAVADGTHATHRIEDVNERVDRLAMIVRAMWTLLEEQGLSAEQLVAKMEELDSDDGAMDGQYKQLPVDCTNCDSKVAPGLAKCQYCGADVNRPDEHPIGQI